MANSIPRSVVEQYLSLEKPRYALLVDAPWGSGKTHFIQRATNCQTDETRLYVSLYNVHTTEEFDWALVRAMNPWTDAKEGKVGGRIKEVISGVQVFGCSVDLTKVNLTEIALRRLPDTLIFDDVERCGLPTKQMWGLINRFVEHEAKRVILIANSNEHTERPELLTTREKLVGQTVTIQADIEAAITSSWVNTPSGQGRSFLQNHQAEIKETFEETGHQNLRLVLRAMRDAATLIDDIDPKIVAFREPMKRLLRTFLSLHMAYHGGKISRDDLLSRGGIAPFDLPKAGEKLTPLKKLEQDHPNADISAYSGPTLSVELGCSLFVDGFASKNTVNEALRATHQFESPTEQPDWMRLWKWVDEKDVDLIAIIDKIDQRMRNFELSNPGELLQIFAAKGFMGEYLTGFSAKDHARKFYDYIKQLAAEDKLPARIPSADGSETEYGFEWHSGTIAYGGFGFEPDRRGNFLAKLLISKMDEAFAKGIPDASAKLLASLRSDPLEFRRHLDHGPGSPNYWNTPILHNLDVGKTASALLKCFNDNRTNAGLVFETIGDRKNTSRSELRPEHNWIDDLRNQLVQHARAVSPVCEAQMRLFLRRTMKHA
ncbi:P-loop NTPase fold protein [Ruegeria conchae]|uniref:P-loop NTPase fold protein n=1 Tax=Ruegeria conchae TaxID=981384 RepID=UPI0029C72417|nr:P-loop NTPase fold protein [Ruegeria conchae]